MNTVTLTDSQNDSVVAALFAIQHRIARQIDEVDSITESYLGGRPIVIGDLDSGSLLLTLNQKLNRLIARRAELAELVRIFTAE